MNVRLVGLKKTYRTAQRTAAALNGVDLEVRSSEFFVLLGPSGCGKSTLLNLVAGLERPSAGEIWFGDERVSAPADGVFRPARERNVAMVFQSYALYPHLTAFENIAFPLRIARKKKSAVQSAVEEVAGRLGLTGSLTARPGELSGGQRQRVAIARAIVRQPSVFLLDEPLSNLDAPLRASMREELKRLQRSVGVTTLYVTHDQTEATVLGDRIALLKDGRVEQVGTPDDLHQRPASAFVTEFLHGGGGSPPVLSNRNERRP